MSSVFIATPHTRPFDDGYVTSLMFMDKPDVMFYGTRTNLPVDQGRDVLAESFVQQPEKPEFLLFADSDAAWDSQAVLRLMSRNLPMVTGCIYKRALPPVPTFGRYVGLNDEGHHTYNFGHAIRHILAHAIKLGVQLDTPNAITLEETDDDLMEIDGCGLHFCLIRRDVVEAVQLPRFKAISMGAGEDFYFCRKVQRAGYQIYADLSVQTAHIAGPGVDFGLRELLAFYQYTDRLRSTEHLWDVGGARG